MSTRQIIWASLCGVTLILFFFLIPVDTYNNHLFFFSISGGVIFFITLFLALGDFDSIYEIIDKIPPGTPEPAMRKLSPAAVIPGIILIFILAFYHMGRKDDELKANGVLTKGQVIGGESTKSTRRFQTTTSYNVRVSYNDSLQKAHTFEASINGSDFNNLYEGAQVDVIYSRKYPSLAKVILGTSELSKYKKIPQGEVSITHLIDIFEGKIPKDSVEGFLNTINYEWTTSEADFFINEKKNIAVKLFRDDGQLLYVEQNNLFSASQSEFMEDLEKNGFKSKEASAEGETQRIYYNDDYLVMVERKVSQKSGDEMLSSTVSNVFRLMKKESTE